MYNLKMKFKNYDFQKDNYSYSIGNFFYNNKLYEKKDFPKLFLNNLDINKIKKELSKLNGYFSFVQVSNGILLASVDHMRTYPLFYAINKGKFYISDNANWIRKEIGINEMNELSIEEFYLAGYVSGSDTLYTDIKQMQAGEILRVDLSKKINFNKIESYKYLNYNLNAYKKHQIITENQEQRYLEELHAIVTRTIERLIEFAKGKKIVVPLSAGYDSRLILLKLKQLGYENVLAFTYGKKENKEVKLSKKIAGNIGYDWLLVPYSKQSWKDLYVSEEKTSYFNYAHNLSSVPHIQDFLAVHLMKKENLIPKDSIFVPGHVSGFMINDETYKEIQKKSSNLNTLANFIFKKNYRLWNYNEKSINVNKIKNKIKKELMSMNEEQNNYISLFNNWEWKERQSKFIANSIRVYDYYNYKWWLPLWDLELMNFWKKTPIEARIDKKLYVKYVIYQYSKITGLPLQESIKTDRIQNIDKIKKVIGQANFNYLKKIYFKIKGIKDYDHPFEWYGIMTEKEFKKEYTGNQDINSFLSKDILKNINNKE